MYALCLVKVAAQKKLLSDAKDTINAYVVFKVR